MADSSILLQTAVDAARAGGKIVAEYYRSPMEVQRKGLKDIVTAADLDSEAQIISLIKARFPDHSILAEERGEVAGSSEYTWVIDPLDGTHNFAARIPFCCVSVGLLHRGEPAVGVIYDALHDELFSAEKGKGALLNGEPLSASTRATFDQALIIFGLGYNPDLAVDSLRIAAGLRPRVRTMRVLGSAALEMAYIAAGRFDLFYHQFLYPWDLAAGLLLIREAGGSITDLKGQPAGPYTQRVVAGSEALRRQFLEGLEGWKVGKLEG